MKRGRPRIHPKSKSPSRAAYMLERYRSNPAARLSTRTAHRFRAWAGDSLRSRGLTVADVLGCEVAHAIEHIQKKFKPDMDWSNWGRGPGKWNLDHLVAVCTFDPNDNDSVKSAMHWSNLVPLWHEEHERKSVADCAAARVDEGMRAEGLEPIPF